jgi:hypothetical protein
MKVSTGVSFLLAMKSMVLLVFSGILIMTSLYLISTSLLAVYVNHLLSGWWIWLPGWSLECGLWIEKPASCFITCNYIIHNVWLTVDTINPVPMKEELVFMLILCNISRNMVLHMINCTAHQQLSSNIISCKSTVLSNDILEYGQWPPQSSYYWPFLSHVNRHWLLLLLEHLYNFYTAGPLVALYS